MKKFMTGAAALAFVALASTSASASNLLVNGDFATGDLTGWHLTGLALDGQNTGVINYTNHQNFPTGPFGAVVPQDPYGTSAEGTYFVSDKPFLVTLSQTFNVATTGDYAISFDVFAPQNGRNNPFDAYLGSAVGSSIFNADGLALLSAKSLDGISTVDGVTPDDGWYHFTFDEQLDAGVNALVFGYSVPKNIGKKNPTYASDFILTNVSVAGGVPEPAAWGMMIIGFFGLGALVRRRSATAAGAIA